MPDEYIGVPITVDEDELYQRAVRKVQESFPNWEPIPSGFTDTVFRLCATMAAVGAEVASINPMLIFKAFGPLAGVPPIEATPATATTVWTARDDSGYLIPSQSPVGLTKTGSGNDPVGFYVPSDVWISPGNTVATIEVVAFEAGLAGSGLDTIVRADSLTYISDITLSGVSQDGTDPETLTDYVDRMSQEFETWTLTPILGRDFAILARKVQGIFRSAAIDNYNPANNTYNNEKMVAISGIDANGETISAGQKADAIAFLTFNSLVNWIVNWVDPVYTTVDVTYTAHTQLGVDTNQLKDDINNALADYLNPAYWGMPPGRRDLAIWYNTPIVRVNKVIQVIENVADVDWAEPVTIGEHGGSLSGSDLTMTGVFPLPRAGTFTGTVVTT